MSIKTHSIECRFIRRIGHCVQALVDVYFIPEMLQRTVMGLKGQQTFCSCHHYVKELLIYLFCVSDLPTQGTLVVRWTEGTVSKENYDR